VIDKLRARDAAKRAYYLMLAAAPNSIARRLYYLRWFGLRRPRTLSEKLVYYKLFVRDQTMPPHVDKIEVKKLVAPKLGKEWIIPTLYDGERLPPVNERTWPAPFVIKASHRSAATILVKDEATIDWLPIEKQCAAWTASLYEYGWVQHEWVYTQLKPRILIEEYIGGAQPPPDFKFFVINGRAAIIQVDSDRFTAHTRSFFDRDFRPMTAKLLWPPIPYEVPRPPHFNQMLRAAEALGSQWPFVRVDLYDTDAGPKFGELTFYPEAGWTRFEPKTVDEELGRLWQRW
jgi:TupA-like ATPgrasp